MWDFCIVVSHANIAPPYLVLTKNILNSSKDASFTYKIQQKAHIGHLGGFLEASWGAWPRGAVSEASWEALEQFPGTP